MISPEFRKAQAILLRVGSHSLILASCEASNIWPRGRDADNEPGLCRCRDTGKTEGPVGNHGAAPGHSQHGTIFPVACSSSQTKSTHTRPAAATAKRRSSEMTLERANNVCLIPPVPEYLRFTSRLLREIK